MVVLLVTALVAGFAILLWPQGAGSPSLARDPITVKRALSGASALFGDTITAQVDVLTDDALVDPYSVSVAIDLHPYRVVATDVDRRRRGSVSLLRTVVQLRCLTTECLPRRDGQPFAFKPLGVTYRLGREEKVEQIPWRALAVHSRLSSDPESPLGVVDTPPELSTDFARSPTLLRSALIVLALMLGLGGALLVVQGLWPRFFYSLRAWRRLTPLEQALAQVEAAARLEDETVRRRVLDQLATQLDGTGAPELVLETRGLAWAANAPRQDELTGLVARIRSAVGGSRS
jgi:hypothetical protein